MNVEQSETSEQVEPGRNICGSVGLLEVCVERLEHTLDLRIVIRHDEIRGSRCLAASKSAKEPWALCCSGMGVRLKVQVEDRVL